MTKCVFKLKNNYYESSNFDKDKKYCDFNRQEKPKKTKNIRKKLKLYTIEKFWEEYSKSFPDMYKKPISDDQKLEIKIHFLPVL